MYKWILLVTGQDHVIIHNFSVLNASVIWICAKMNNANNRGHCSLWSVMILFTTSVSERMRAWVCAAVHVCGLPSIQSTFCPARVDLCLAAEQICQDCLVYIPKPERLHTWSQPSVKAQLTPGSTSGTKHQLTCPVMTSYDLLTTSTM